MKLFKSISTLFLVALGMLSGGDMAEAATVQSQRGTSLYDYTTTIVVQDEFIGGTASTSGTVGALGFGFANGTSSQIASETGRLGIYRRDTTSSSGTIATLVLYVGSSAGIDPALPHSVVWVARLNTNDANTTVRLGELNSVSVNPPAQGIFIEKLDGDTNWFCVTRAANVQTRVDSGIAVSTSFITIKYARTAAGVAFSLNNAPVCGAITTNIPTTFTNPGLHITNSAAAAKTVDVDYFEMQITGLAR